MIIKNLRLENGWSQEKLAELTSLSTRTIQRIEKDDSASLESLNLLASAFNMETNDLRKRLKQKELKRTYQNSITKEKKIVIFVLVNLLLFVINITTSREHLWFIYPLLGWGIPLFYKKYKMANSLS